MGTDVSAPAGGAVRGAHEAGEAVCKLPRVLTREEADQLAAPFGHPAAVELVLQAATAPDWERRERSRRALHILNPDVPLVDGLELGESCPPWALAIGVAAVEIALYLGHGLLRSERRRVAGLLAALCLEARRLGAVRENEAA